MAGRAIPNTFSVRNLENMGRLSRAGTGDELGAKRMAAATEEMAASRPGIGSSVLARAAARRAATSA
jgi:hypothetical protein